MKRFFSIAAVVVAVLAATVHAAPLPVVVLGAGEAQPVRTPWCQEFDRALSADTLYLVTGLYYVESGFSLTIEPGTVIMGDSETGGTLIVTRGAQIFAQGTQQKPIVFTSEKAIGNRNPGDWGGVIVLGAAPVNKVEPAHRGRAHRRQLRRRQRDLRWQQSGGQQRRPELRPYRVRRLSLPVE